MTEFEKQLHSMFDHIWECEIDHPVFQDTVGELMSAVIQCYNNLPSAQPKPCEDAVSREAISEWLKQYGQYVLHGKYKFSLMYIWKNLMDLPSAQPEQRWITSGKPMNSGMYLVTLRQKFEGEEAYRVRIMRFINGNWMLPKHFPEWINEEIEQEVLAWRELPEPWKEGEADG